MGMGPVITGGMCLLTGAQAAMLCFAHRSLRGADQTCLAGWMYVACLMLVPSVIHLFSLDLVLSDLFRQWVRSHGWYAYRRPLQFAAVAFLALTFLWAAASGFAHQVRRTCRSTWYCLVMSVLVLFCAVVRVVSWHSTDALLNWPIGGLSAGRWVEWSALASMLLVINARLLSRWSWS